MASSFSVSKPGTLLLSAGPRAGKTRFLLERREQAQGPCIYVGLTPEDADPTFFLSRLLGADPELKGRFEALRAAHDLAAGALLGRAISELHPDFCLLVDDFHLAEGTPLEAELLALIRQLPEGGTLVAASRHRFPEIRRSNAIVRDVDDAMWQESPAPEDLIVLPAALMAKALVLHLVGAGDPSPAGWELVRRNLAWVGADGQHHLRASWAKVADEALSRRKPERVWDHLAEELLAFWWRHIRTGREQEVSAILARVPAEERRCQPGMLLLDGYLLMYAWENMAARGCYERVLALAPSQALRNDALLGLLKLATRGMDGMAAEELLGRLEAPDASLSPAQEVDLHVLRGQRAWSAGDVAGAIESYERVWSLPDAGERRILEARTQALYALCLMYIDLSKPREALAYAEPMVAITEAQGFHRDLATMYAARLSCRFLDQSRRIPLRALMEIPNEGLRWASPLGLQRTLVHFGVRALRLGVYPLALVYFRLLEANARFHKLTIDAQMARYWQMLAHSRLGDFDRARRLYEDICATAGNRRFLHGIQAPWGEVLIEAGRLEEAETHLQGCLSLFEDGPDRAKVELLCEWGRHQQGDAGALERARAILATPQGAACWDVVAQLLGRLGLRRLPPIYHLRAFGGLSFGVAGQPPVRWSRRKALSLIAHLMRRPEGLGIGDLVERLYQGSRNSDPVQALHTLAYGLRQGLKTVGADALLEFSDDAFHWRAERVDFCDVAEFDALYEKARSLEEDGLEAHAALFYQLALALVQGTLFDDLPDDFRAEREHHQARVSHAKAFVQAHGFSIEAESLLL